MDIKTGREELGEHLKFERKDVWDMKWADVRIFLYIFSFAYDMILNSCNESHGYN